MIGWSPCPPTTASPGRDQVLLDELATEPVIINVVWGITSLQLWAPDHRPAIVVPVRNVDE
jgi:hypothetical protein